MISRQLKWYYKNRERALENGRKYYDTNKEMVKSYEREHYKNKSGPRKRETSRLRYHANKIKRDEQIKKYKQAHPEIGYKSSMKKLRKLALEHQMSDSQYKWANMCWKNLVKKHSEDRCVICGESGQDIELHAHHLIFKSTEPALSLVPTNGMMLCVPHHKELHKLNPIKQKRY